MTTDIYRHGVHADLRDMPLIRIPFKARCAPFAQGTVGCWIGPNAALVVGLLASFGNGNSIGAQLPWPMRMLISKVRDMRLQIGEAIVEAGDYPIGTQEGPSGNRQYTHQFIPSVQLVRTLDVRIGSVLEGELWMEPLVVPEDGRAGMLITEAEFLRQRWLADPE